MSTVTAKLADWLRHPSSSVSLVPKMDVIGAGTFGPTGGIENSLHVELKATSALQRLAYSNTRLGALRGNGRFSTSFRFNTYSARTKLSTLVRWDPARLEDPAAGYVVEVLFDVDGFLYCTLRTGPDESGSVFFSKRLDPAFGFVPNRWVEIGAFLDVDSVGNLKITTLIRPNTERGVSTSYPTFHIDSDTWYAVPAVSVPRHAALISGHVGWQIITRAQDLTPPTTDPVIRMGGFRAIADATSVPTILPDVVAIPP